MAGLTQMPRENEQILDPRTKRLSRSYRRYLLDTRVQVIGIDTITAITPSVNLAQVDARLIVVKDEGGNAVANPITILGTVQGVLNPTIATSYGVLRLYGHDNLWFYW